MFAKVAVVEEKELDDGIGISLEKDSCTAEESGIEFCIKEYVLSKSMVQSPIAFVKQASRIWLDNCVCVKKCISSVVKAESEPVTFNLHSPQIWFPEHGIEK